MKNKIVKKAFCIALSSVCLFSFPLAAFAESNTVSLWGKSFSEVEFQLDNNKDYLQQVIEHNQKTYAKGEKDTTPELLKICTRWLSMEEQIQLVVDAYDSALGSFDIELERKSSGPEYQQKLQWNDKIKETALEITKDCTNDYEKCQAIHDWICNNIWYDMDHYHRKTVENQDAVFVLENKRAVCAGYTNLTAEMLRAVNIPAKEVDGTALGLDSPDEWTEEILKRAENYKTNHAWTEAYVNGKWLIMDTTWDSLNQYENGKFGTKKPIRQDYFDVDIKTFSKDHFIRKYDIPDVENIEKKVIPWPQQTTAQTIKYPIVLDGTKTSLNIKRMKYDGGKGYYEFGFFYKLRDLEQLLQGTPKQFQVTWDEKQKAIHITTGTAPTTPKTDIVLDNKEQYNANLNNVAVYVDGKKTNLTIYKVNDSNYVRLRELAEAINLYIGMELTEIRFLIDTSRDYEAAPDYRIYQ